MRQLRAWASRFKGLFFKDARERELAEELESHLRMHIDDNIRAGMSSQEARCVAWICSRTVLTHSCLSPVHSRRERGNGGRFSWKRRQSVEASRFRA